MPPEMDDGRIAAIRRTLKKRHVMFLERAHSGLVFLNGERVQAEADELGLNRLFNSKLTPLEKERALIRGMIGMLDAGNRPDRLDMDYGTIYEFRFHCQALAIYVKTEWTVDVAGARSIKVISIKKQN